MKEKQRRVQTRSTKYCKEFDRTQIFFIEILFLSTNEVQNIKVFEKYNSPNEMPLKF